MVTLLQITSQLQDSPGITTQNTKNASVLVLYYHLIKPPLSCPTEICSVTATTIHANWDLQKPPCTIHQYFSIRWSQMGTFVQQICTTELLWSKTSSNAFVLWCKSWETICIQTQNFLCGNIKDRGYCMLYKKHIIEFTVLPKLWIISLLDSALKFQQCTKNSFSLFSLMD